MDLNGISESDVAEAKRELERLHHQRHALRVIRWRVLPELEKAIKSGDAYAIASSMIDLRNFADAAGPEPMPLVTLRVVS